ncbi:MAG: peptidylprolyl isomerase [Zetaproteobacteria bacterium]|nr:peptidylprolyl isomerase [Zetaproteobacteria bacterium]
MFGLFNKGPKASARHILVSDEATCLDLKAQIEGGADFAKVAAEHSSCPSGKQGGNLGEFTQGQMVKEFDEVVFRDALNQVHGPIQTQFGYHLIEITARSE